MHSASHNHTSLLSSENGLAKQFCVTFGSRNYNYCCWWGRLSFTKLPPSVDNKIALWDPACSSSNFTDWSSHHESVISQPEILNNCVWNCIVLSRWPVPPAGRNSYDLKLEQLSDTKVLFLFTNSQEKCGLRTTKDELTNLKTRLSNMIYCESKTVFWRVCWGLVTERTSETCSPWKTGSIGVLGCV